jgi:kynurenine 3-monooxygenase
VLGADIIPVVDSDCSVASTKGDTVTIFGAGPTGLATAVMLARRGYRNIEVLERLSEPPNPKAAVWNSGERSYNIGISGRGQKTLKALDLMDRVELYSSDVVGRKDWSPEAPIDKPREIIYTGKSYVTKCIQRDLLAAALLEEIRARYADTVAVKFQNHVVDLQFEDNGVCNVFIEEGDDQTKTMKTKRSNWVIGADGGPSALRTFMENEAAIDNDNKFRVKRYKDNNVRMYRTIPLHLPIEGPGKKVWRRDLNYSARTKSGINIDALPTKSGPYVAVVLYRPNNEIIKSIKSASDARQFFKDILPQFNDVLLEKDLENFAAKGNSRLPRFMYAGPQLHRGNNSVLIGDSVHTVKPYFGLGVNSALEDVLCLDEALTQSNDDVGKALKLFSDARGKEARAMVQISKRLDGGFLTFVLPLLIDNLLHKKLPKIFSANTLSSLQNENATFTQIRFRKRVDRVLQVLLLGTIATGLGKSLRFVVSRLM